MLNARKEHWERIYADKAPSEVSWYQQAPYVSLKLINKMKLSHDAWIIDIGGGASTLIDKLVADGYRNLAVLDISERALSHARERLGEAARRVAWFAEDVTRFDSPQRFDVWHDRAVFHFLTEPTDRALYRETLERTLEPHGEVVIATFAIGGPTRCSGLEIVQYDSDRISEELGGAYELIEMVPELHVTPSGGEQAFNFFHFSRR